MTLFLRDLGTAIGDFLESGGPVLGLITAVMFLMWLLIFERLIYYRGPLRRRLHREADRWNQRPEHRSWHAQAIREAAVSRIRLAANRSLPTIRTLVALCPLLGLLGTVTGMIDVFDAMAFSDAGSARTMAAGVSRATIPTMAGMVGALTGLMAVTLLARVAERHVHRFETQLELD
jgi:biopolymer transport protein ExbB